MSKNKTPERKALELRQLKADALKSELELEQAQLRTAKLRRDYAHEDADPEHRGHFDFIGVVDTIQCIVFADKVQRYASTHPGSPITITIQSPGGSVLAGLGLYDTLRTLSLQGHHITTQVRGYAASFGAILLQAGDTRLVGAESLIMLHEISSGAIGKLHEMKDELKFLEMANRRLFAILAGRTKGKWDADKLYERVEAKDWWISADECVAEGFADQVG